MTEYIALICTMEDFGLPVENTGQELIECYIEEADWLTSYRFEVPENTPEEIVTRVGRGVFWENDWTMDGTVSTVMVATAAEVSEDEPEVEPESIMVDDGSADVEVDDDEDEVDWKDDEDEVDWKDDEDFDE